MINLSKTKHRKVIFSFVVVFLLSLFICGLLKDEASSKEYEYKISIIDTSEEVIKGNASQLDHALKEGYLPEKMEYAIKLFIKAFEAKSLVDCYQVTNSQVVEWLLEYRYYEGWRINCVIGEWIILVRE